MTIIFSLLDALLGWEKGCTTTVSLCDLFLTLNEIQRAKYVIFYFSCEFDLTLQLLGLIILAELLILTLVSGEN